MTAGVIGIVFISLDIAGAARTRSRDASRASQERGDRESSQARQQSQQPPSQQQAPGQQVLLPPPPPRPQGDNRLGKVPTPNAGTGASHTDDTPVGRVERQDHPHAGDREHRTQRSHTLSTPLNLGSFGPPPNPGGGQASGSNLPPPPPVRTRAEALAIARAMVRYEPLQGTPAHEAWCTELYAFM